MTPSGDGNRESGPSGDNSHGLIPSNASSGPSRRPSGHSDGHVGNVSGLTPDSRSDAGNVSSRASSSRNDGCSSVIHGLTSSSDGSSVSDSSMGGNDGHVGTVSGLTPSGDNEEADPSEWLIPAETILIEDDDGGFLLGDMEQFIMVSIHKAIIYYCRPGLI